MPSSDSKKKDTRSNVIVSNEGQKVIIYVKKKFALVSAGCLAGLILVCSGGKALASVINRPDVTSFIKVDVSGYNGSAKAEYTISEKDILNKVYGVKSAENLRPDDKEQYEKLLQSISNALSVNEGTTDNLSNGDEFELKINGLEDIAEHLDLKFKKNDVLKYTVSELKEARTISVSDLIDAEFKGYDKGGCVLLSLKKDADVPFKISERSVYGQNGLTVDDNYFLNIEANGKEGKLSNGETYELKLNLNEGMNDYLLELYGVCIDTAPAEYSVSGLSEATNLEIFSLIDITAAGLEGEASLRYIWKDPTTESGDVILKTREGSPRTFTLYSKNTTNYEPIGFVKEESDNSEKTEESVIDTFELSPDKNSEINIDDKIEVKIINGSGEEVGKDDYAYRGVVFSEASKSLEIDKNMLSRYVTADSQVSDDALKKFAETVAQDVPDNIEKHWSDAVHNDYNFTSYDHELSELKARTGYLGTVSHGNNIYTACILFTAKVKDSELPDGKEIVIVVHIPDLRVKGDGSIDTANITPQNSFYENTGEFENEYWFKKLENLRTVKLD